MLCSPILIEELRKMEMILNFFPEWRNKCKGTANAYNAVLNPQLVPDPNHWVHLYRGVSPISTNYMRAVVGVATCSLDKNALSGCGHSEGATGTGSPSKNIGFSLDWRVALYFAGYAGDGQFTPDLERSVILHAYLPVEYVFAGSYSYGELEVFLQGQGSNGVPSNVGVIQNLDVVKLVDLQKTELLREFDNYMKNSRSSILVHPIQRYTLTDQQNLATKEVMLHILGYDKKIERFS